MSYLNDQTPRGRLMIMCRYINYCGREEEAQATLRMMSTTGRKQGEIFLANLCLKKALDCRQKIDRVGMNRENRTALQVEYIDAIERFREVVKKSSVAVLRPLPTTKDL